MTDENFTGVRATTADEEAVMFRQSWIKAERENARLRSELTDYKDAAASEAGRVNELTAENRSLREENARLREAVKAAYYEGWQDNASIDDTEDRLHAEWEYSEACVAIRETSK